MNVRFECMIYVTVVHISQVITAFFIALVLLEGTGFANFGQHLT